MWLDHLLLLFYKCRYSLLQRKGYASQIKMNDSVLALTITEWILDVHVLEHRIGTESNVSWDVDVVVVGVGGWFAHLDVGHGQLGGEIGYEEHFIWRVLDANFIVIGVGVKYELQNSVQEISSVEESWRQLQKEKFMLE